MGRYDQVGRNTSDLTVLLADFNGMRIGDFVEEKMSFPFFLKGGFNGQIIYDWCMVNGRDIYGP